jgi:hypothetical protein
MPKPRRGCEGGGGGAKNVAARGMALEGGGDMVEGRKVGETTEGIGGGETKDRRGAGGREVFEL